jgi:hypothetical protein
MMWPRIREEEHNFFVKRLYAALEECTCTHTHMRMHISLLTDIRSIAYTAAMLS